MEINENFVNTLKELVLKLYNDSKEMKMNVKNKELNDIVTDIDVYIENGIIKSLKEWFPEHNIDSEERGEQLNNSDYTWIIDPIDGTVNFTSNIPLFATSIALMKNDETIFGFIYDYARDDLYYTFKGKGAYCNGKRISVSKNDTLSNSIISFCLTSHYNDKHIRKAIEAEFMLAKKVRGLRLIVSSTIELAWCASGKTDGCINVKPSRRISSRAGMLLVSEAGGKVTNLKGNQTEKEDTLIASNGLIHNAIVQSLNYVVFIGNITEVLEISENKELKNKRYIAGKAYSQAISASKSGTNVKLLTAISGIQKDQLAEVYNTLKENNVDASYIKVINGIENDLKFVIKDDKEIKRREEDFVKGSAEAVNKELINENIDLIKEAKYVICQTKINPDVTKYIIDSCYESKVDCIVTTSRPQNFICADNEENERLLEKIKFLICTKSEFDIIFNNASIDILKKYPNKIIILQGNEAIYYDGENMKAIKNKEIENFEEVGKADLFIGQFVSKLCEEKSFEEF